MCVIYYDILSSHLDQDSRLIVRVRCELLHLLGGDGGVPLDDGGEHSSRRLQTQRQRRHVEQEQVLNCLVLVSTQDSGLHGWRQQHQR